MNRLLLSAIVFILVAAPASSSDSKPKKHSITVTFDYDFSATPACLPDAVKVKDTKKPCVQEFVVYDISVGVAKRTRLATIPVPVGAHGQVKGISGQTPSLAFASGDHVISVVAVSLDGKESDPYKCTTTVKVPK
ncbi:MAG TPA: hypothetical protein VMU43_14450 [Candidatus Acidoferrum sp.]|nr:hypothetical protein [Candidatus Acidoferrum sp.]